VNREPYDGGWFYKVKLGDVSQSAELMSPEQYDRLISQT
jgi:glycine cleavage system H lipoate-binding protein